MTPRQSYLRCIHGCESHALEETVYSCSLCGSLLEVVHPDDTFTRQSPAAWRRLFSERDANTPGPYGSGVWRYHEWVLPQLPTSAIVTLGEGNTPLVATPRLSEQLGVEVLIKQCGQSLSGSFKDLGMTVLISQVNAMRRQGIKVPAIVCASTGDTSAALAAYGAAAGIRTLVLLPRGKITAAQMVQPLAHGARVIAIDTDFDGCMRHVQRLATQEGVYLANSKNSLRIEGQKSVAFEIAQGLKWQPPTWVAIPGGNLGNVAALARGFNNLLTAGLITRLPRLLCVQAAHADPLYRSFKNNFSPLEPVTAAPTQASAIRIGNPVSFAKAVAALQETNGIVEVASEAELTQAAYRADRCGLYTCPHTAVALAGVEKLRSAGAIRAGDSVVVVATAHGLKFTEFKTATVENRVPGAPLRQTATACEVPDDYQRVRDAALAEAL